MDAHARILCFSSKKGDFLAAIGKSGFGTLAEGKHGWFTTVHIAIVQQSWKVLNAELALVPENKTKPGRRLKLDSTALVDKDVRVVLAYDFTETARKLGNRQGIGRRPGENWKKFQVALKNYPELVSNLRGDFVFRIGGVATRQRILKALKNNWSRRAGIVRTKVVHAIVSIDRRILSRPISPSN